MEEYEAVNPYQTEQPVMQQQPQMEQNQMEQNQTEEKKERMLTSRWILRIISAVLLGGCILLICFSKIRVTDTVVIHAEEFEQQVQHYVTNLVFKGEEMGMMGEILSTFGMSGYLDQVKKSVMGSKSDAWNVLGGGSGVNAFGDPLGQGKKPAEGQEAAQEGGFSVRVMFANIIKYYFLAFLGFHLLFIALHLFDRRHSGFVTVLINVGWFVLCFLIEMIMERAHMPASIGDFFGQMTGNLLLPFISFCISLTAFALCAVSTLINEEKSRKK